MSGGFGSIAWRAVVGRRGKRLGSLVAAWLCVVSMLVMGGCDSGDSATKATVYAAAPVSSSLLVYTMRGTSLVAYRVRDGSPVWSYQPDGEHYELDYGLIYHDGLVLGDTFSSAHPDHMTLLAVRATDGKALWHVRMAGLIPPMMALADDYVALELGDQQTPNSLEVIRASDGTQTRSIPLPGSGWIAADGDVAFHCTYDAVLSAYRLSDGQRLWSAPVAPGLAVPNEGCPLEAAGGIVFCHVQIATGQGGTQNTLVAVRENDGRPLWRKPMGLDSLANGVGYYVSGNQYGSATGQHIEATLNAFRAETGALLWQVSSTSDSADIVADGSEVVFRQSMGLEGVSAEDGTTLWQVSPPSDHFLVVAGAVDGVVLAVSEGSWSIHNPAPPGTDTRPYLLAYGATDGKLYWQRPIDFVAVAA